MGKIENYGFAEQVSGAPKGSVENPYTMEEYENLLNGDLWPGGYVEGLGYVIKEVVVKPSGHTSGGSFWGSFYDSFSSWIGSMFGSDETYDENMHPDFDENNKGNGSYYGNPYPQGTKTFKAKECCYSWGEGIGINGSFYYDCGVKINGYRMYVSASIQPINFVGREFSANVVVTADGHEFTYPLSYYSGGYITSDRYTAIGSCEVELPKARSASIVLHIGFLYNTGIGWLSGLSKITIL